MRRSTSATNPRGECAFLEAGDRLPGIPRHRFKAGVEYWVTSKWKVGSRSRGGQQPAVLPQRRLGRLGLDENLAGYTRVDLNTSYDITDNVQIYGLVKNLFNSKYGLYGTYFEVDEVSHIDQALGGPGFNDPRTISPSMPFAAYGGVKVKY